MSTSGFEKSGAARWLAAVGLVAGWAAAAGAQAPPVDLERVGPKVGERAPAFTLTDQHGRTRSLESVLGDRGAMLVFFRSADW